MPPAAYALIVNPESANGRTGRDWATLEQRFREALGDIALFQTEGPGDGNRLTRQALEAGHTHIISVGGDGTHSEVLNGFFNEDEALINPEAKLGIFPRGSGNDLARSLGIPLQPHLDPDYLRQFSTIMADVGIISYHDPEGHTRHRYFINTCHIGIGGLVSERANQRGKALGGALSYLWHTLIALLWWEDVDMHIEVDDTHYNGKIKEIIIANGSYYGGGMRISPPTALNNGEFSVYIVHAMSFLKTLLKVHVLYKGNFVNHPELVSHYQARERISIRSEKPLIVGVDGESPGYLPITITIRPQALPLLTGKPAPVNE